MRTAKSKDRTQLAYHECKSGGGPSALVVKGQKGSLYVNMRSHSPQYNNRGNEACNMYGHGNILHARQDALSEDVDKARCHCRGDNQEPTLPSRRCIVGVAHADERLDQQSLNEHARGVTRLPGKSRKPAGEVGEEALVLLGCELGCPVILSASGPREKSVHVAKSAIRSYTPVPLMPCPPDLQR